MQGKQELKSRLTILIHMYFKLTPCFLAFTCVRVAHFKKDIFIHLLVLG